MSNFGENLTALIKDNNLTITQLSNLLNISSSQMSKYCSGAYEPSLNNAITIVNHFNCSLDYICGLQTIPNSFNILKEPNVNTFKIRLQDLINIRHTNINRISKHIYVNRNNIYNWQKSDNFPKLWILSKLAQELSTSIEYLIGRTDVLGV